MSPRSSSPARTVRTVPRLHLAVAVAATAVLAGALLLVPRVAHAQVFLEDWEGGSTARWRAVDGKPIVVTTDPGPICSSHFQRETIPFSGGRVFTKAGIPVTGGKPYCLSAFVRGSAGTQPFVGISLANAMGTTGAEHWLIGRPGYPDGYGGTVTPVVSDGVWHFYARAFTVEGNATHVVLKDELFQEGAAGSADFDDLQLTAGACPAPPPASHVVCVAPTAVCTASGACVQCTPDHAAACTGKTPVCNAATHTCRPCAGDKDCGGATPACQPSGACGVCSKTNATKCVGTTPVCNAASGTCRPCAGDGECSGATPACEPTGACGQCSTTNQGKCVGTTPVCNTTAGTCRACADDSECGGATPACAPSGACRQCTKTNPTACVGATPVCDTTTSSCVLCTPGPNGSAAACATNPAGHACVVGQKGAFCGCAVDADCGGKTSGRVCDVSAHTCVAGCSPAPNRNGCPVGLFCTSHDLTGATTGVCTTGCNVDADCAQSMPSLPRCLTGLDGGGSACVACNVDKDCANGLLCAPSHACVACTPMKSGACSPDKDGAACLEGGKCGCLVDADCGGMASGRVCDPATSACAAGCRGVGGNGCPAGLVCTSTTNKAGDCVAPPDMTGGGLPDLATSSGDGGGATGDGAVGGGDGSGGGDGAAMGGDDGGGTGGDGAITGGDGATTGDDGATTGPDLPFGFDDPAGTLDQGGGGDGGVTGDDGAATGADSGGIAGRVDLGSTMSLAGGGCGCAVGASGQAGGGGGGAGASGVASLALGAAALWLGTLGRRRRRHGSGGGVDREGR